MRKLAFLLTLIIAFSGLLAQDFNYQRDFAKVLAHTQDSSHKLYHKKLMVKYMENNPDLSDYEMLALLIHYTSDPHYKPYEILSQEEGIKSLIEQKDYEKALRLCDSLLKHHPFNQAILFEMALMNFELERFEESENFRTKFNRIMDAMAYSGSGNSAENAIFSLGSKDSHHYIANRLSYTIQNVGAGQDDSGNMIDIIEAYEEGKGTRLLHFQIQHAVNQLMENSK
jgi:hypothetical protein